MYYLESLISLNFEKHCEYGPDILIYITNALLVNIPLATKFEVLLSSAQETLAQTGTNNLYTSNADENALNKQDNAFLLERFIKIYMKSRQKSWRRFNQLIPEKGSSSLRENLKTMQADTNRMEIPKTKTLVIKKSMLPTDLNLALNQLRVWAAQAGSENAFEKAFTLTELKDLVQCFREGDEKIKGRKKTDVIELLLAHIRNADTFSQLTRAKGALFGKK
jgi:hypothetical protein